MEAMMFFAFVLLAMSLSLATAAHSRISTLEKRVRELRILLKEEHTP